MCKNIVKHFSKKQIMERTITFIFSVGLLRCFLEMSSRRHGRTSCKVEKSIVQQRNFILGSAMDNCKQRNI